MVVEKRRAEDSSSLVPVSKKSKNEVATSNKNKSVLQAAPARTSNLFAPIMLLEGHEGEIFTVEFHPEGQYVASSGFDRRIFVWSVYGECENLSVMSGHTGAVMELHFTTDGTNIFTASTDHTLGLWDLPTSQRIKKYKGHTTFVNSVQGARRGPQMLVSGSDDTTIKLWDIRKKQSVTTFNSNYQVTAVEFNDTAEQIFSGGIDNDIKVWDIRNHEIIYTLKGHTDTVTGLALSPDGSYLLSNSMDNSLRIWDVRPYAPQERCVKVFTGHQHNFEKNLLRCAWSKDGSKVSSGSADRFLYIWDTTSRRIIYKLPGHNGSVNDVDFHPNEPIVVSGASDKQIYLGEID
ncbi:U5 small nuclear ribonucleoprotein 40 kDa protein [Tribolium castaneum]|uniref:U5 small nuclear ribonucleoprotein 40 kDa protein n=1 Tax=Tribolium castaneum TaxID=7070 RepID=D6WYC4_TRICA|nr:PREDICTED: U5 small nuclear ribonucleoprotein 40 kDa protein [Tribolium castaneum]EFA09115.1 Protein will die slowly-like Protein [Tribolium castaneum]|eukprot:XP_968017.1 PREDICTED: U5 small nuclear ribonucleoprotein 40 kDa protein [Tribolium castaneum]